MYKDTVLADKSRRRRRDEAITNQKPAYYDRIAENELKYLEEKERQMHEINHQQRSIINKKYSTISQMAANKTKQGELSAKEFRDYQDLIERQKEKSKLTQLEYKKALDSQIQQKSKPEFELPNSKNQRLTRNSSMPMIPGINSHSYLSTNGDAEKYLDDHRVKVKKYLEIEDKHDFHRSSFEHLPTTLSMKIANNTRNRNQLEKFRTSAPNLHSIKPSSKWISNVIAVGKSLRMSAMTTLQPSQVNNRYSTFERGKRK